MNLRISIVIIVLAVYGCKKESNSKNFVGDIKSSEFSSKYLIEAEELLKIFKNPNIKIIDFRKPEFYLEEHLPRAINIWRTDIEDKTFPYKGMMASTAQIENLFGSLGISDDNTIIIYDNNGLCDSARLWWILQNYDFSNVKLLHGGIKAWKMNNGTISTTIPKSEKVNFTLPKSPSMKYYISKDEMVEAIINEKMILDTRTDDEFSGKRQKSGSFRGGRIPNSKVIDWSNAINYHGNMKLKPHERLFEIYKNFALKNDTLIVYCHSGVRSAHTTFVLTQVLGYKNVKNYDGSWTEWSYFNDLPIEQDSITKIFN
ncbi:MAG: sulfurtransferase [Flaviramulus sp.]|nr:sulfurtransferase [Flaviramulus sp.]NNC50349.1 sulfurtransferase [Flaviramulus sp.]